MTRMNQMTRRLSLFLLIVICGWLPMGAAQADTVTYYHTDALGTPVMESNAAGQVTYVREHRPYGEQMLGAAKNGPGFTGHVGDADTGLTYMQQRYYDPVAGRFLSSDPVAANSNTGGNFNRYWYANNNPYAFTDPDGRLPLGNQTNEPLADGQDFTMAQQEGGARGLGTVANTKGSHRRFAAAVRERIAAIAKSYIGSNQWAYDKARGPYGPDTNKCNLFVHEVLGEAGAALAYMNGGVAYNLFGIGDAKYPVLAGQWGDPNFAIPGWSVVNGAPMPGDIVAQQSFYADASGHVGIYLPGSLGQHQTVSVSSNTQTVVHNGWGYRSSDWKKGDIVVRRYTGK